VETTAPLKLSVCLAAMGCVVAFVSTLRIQAAPSAGHAIVALRVAHLELFWARSVFRDPAVDEAEAHFDKAWSNLRDRRYARSVLAAAETLHHIRGIKEGVPWLVGNSSSKSKQPTISEIITYNSQVD
jgi:hypothetical protein